VTGDSYRIRRHRNTINTIRPALTGRRRNPGDHNWRIPVILDSGE
jgi:hypothetical protein